MTKRRKSGSVKGSRSSAQEWTFLEKTFGVVIVILVVVAAYGFMVKDEIVEVGSIETYAATVDLRPGDGDASRYSFTRELRENYLLRATFKVVEVGPLVHFRVWNESTGRTLIKDTTDVTYDREIRIDNEDWGTYDFEWWVEDGSGSSRVDIDFRIQPTEKIFEKKT
jgi:hypothetical protein